jgi:hypothetical protein
MAHKTLVNGTAYEVSGGKTMVDGTGYDIKGGRTLVDGTGYDVRVKSDDFILFENGTFASGVTSTSYHSYVPSNAASDIRDGKLMIWNGSDATLTMVIGIVDLTRYSTLHVCGYGDSVVIGYGSAVDMVCIESVVGAFSTITEKDVTMSVAEADGNQYIKITPEDYDGYIAVSKIWLSAD